MLYSAEDLEALHGWPAIVAQKFGYDVEAGATQTLPYQARLAKALSRWGERAFNNQVGQTLAEWSATIHDRPMARIQAATYGRFVDYRLLRQLLDETESYGVCETLTRVFQVLRKRRLYKQALEKSYSLVTAETERERIEAIANSRARRRHRKTRDRWMSTDYL